MPIKQGGKLGKELQDLSTSQLAADNNLTCIVNAVHLKNVLRDIQTNGANLIHGWLLSYGSLSTVFLAHRDAGGGAVHSINTEAMNLHLCEINTQVTTGAHAVVILDQAGWHKTHDPDLPDNIRLLFLKPYSPELNPIENLFQFLRHNFLNARVYDTYDNIVDACC